MTRTEALEFLGSFDQQFLKAEVFGFKKFSSSRPLWGLDWSSLPTSHIRIDMLQLWHNSLNRQKLISLVNDATFTSDSCQPIHVYKNNNFFGVADGNHRTAVLSLLGSKLIGCKIYNPVSIDGGRVLLPHDIDGS